MAYKPAKRNWDNIQHESVRRKVDPYFIRLHDELSAAFYDRQPFLWEGHDYGVLTKVEFDQLHALIFHHRVVVFHAENLKQPIAARIPEREYNEIQDAETGSVLKKDEVATTRILAAKTKGYELTINFTSVVPKEI